MKQEQTDAMERAVEAATVAWSEMGDDWFSPRPEEAREKFWDAFSAGWNARAAALEAGKAVDENGLKPCPFCGSRAAIHRFDDMDIVECDACPAQMSSFALWNRRTGDAG
jgi:hypothetical protein